jgi:hypothetical protein
MTVNTGMREIEDRFIAWAVSDRAIRAAFMELFRWVARETASSAGYEYPTEMEEHVVALMAPVLQETAESPRPEAQFAPSGAFPDQ